MPLIVPSQGCHLGSKAGKTAVHKAEHRRFQGWKDLAVHKVGHRPDVEKYTYRTQITILTLNFNHRFKK